MSPDPKKGYRKTFSLHGESPKSLQWKNYQSAVNRYRQIVADLDIHDKSVLDVGCGMGDLLPFLYSAADSFHYLGVDIVPEFIDVAKKRYDGYNFELANPFDDDFQRHFDVIVLCGALNANKANWLQQRFEKINKLYDLADQQLTFNMAGSFEMLPLDTRVAYAYIPDVLDYCRTLSNRVILRAHYSDRDFTISMFK